MAWMSMSAAVTTVSTTMSTVSTAVSNGVMHMKGVVHVKRIMYVQAVMVMNMQRIMHVKGIVNMQAIMHMQRIKCVMTVVMSTMSTIRADQIRTGVCQRECIFLAGEQDYHQANCNWEK